jgi:hypothetical protein
VRVVSDDLNCWWTAGGPGHWHWQPHTHCRAAAGGGEQGGEQGQGGGQQGQGGGQQGQGGRGLSVMRKSLSEWWGGVEGTWSGWG